MRNRVVHLGRLYLIFGGLIPLVGLVVLFLERVVAAAIQAITNWIIAIPYAILGAITSICSAGTQRPAPAPDPPIGPPLWGTQDMKSLGIWIFASVCWIIVGHGLYRVDPWSRTLALGFSIGSSVVLAVVFLFGALLPAELHQAAAVLSLMLPFGIALRIYTVVVLGSDEGAELYQTSGARVVHRKSNLPPSLPPGGTLP